MCARAVVDVKFGGEFFFWRPMRAFKDVSDDYVVKFLRQAVQPCAELVDCKGGHFVDVCWVGLVLKLMEEL